MDEDAPHRMRWPRVLARVIGYPLLAVGLYVLSSGPAYYTLQFRSLAIDRALDAIYAPLDWLVTHTDLLDPLAPYYQWWSLLPGGAGDRVDWHAVHELKSAAP